jgi:hypothetical protein
LIPAAHLKTPNALYSSPGKTMDFTKIGASISSFAIRPMASKCGYGRRSVTTLHNAARQ